MKSKSILTISRIAWLVFTLLLIAKIVQLKSEVRRLEQTPMTNTINLIITNTSPVTVITNLPIDGGYLRFQVK